jgi:hypothetical protein
MPSAFFHLIAATLEKAGPLKDNVTLFLTGLDIRSFAVASHSTMLLYEAPPLYPVSVRDTWLKLSFAETQTNSKSK